MKHPLSYLNVVRVLRALRILKPRVKIELVGPNLNEDYVVADQIIPGTTLIVPTKTAVGVLVNGKRLHAKPTRAYFKEIHRQLREDHLLELSEYCQVVNARKTTVYHCSWWDDVAAEQVVAPQAMQLKKAA